MLCALRRTTDPAAELTCLTDYDFSNFGEGIHPVRLVHDWPGWWSKIELFRPNLFPGERIVYLDLDLVILGDLSSIADSRYDFVASRPRFYKAGALNSSVLAFVGGSRPEIYANMGPRERAHYDSLGVPWGGDQGYISRFVNGAYLPVQALVNTAIWKRDGIPEGTDLLYFSGEPKPTEVANREPILQEYMQCAKIG